jgi:hypothetical protein
MKNKATEMNEKLALFEERFTLLSLWSRNIAMLPLEEMLESLNLAESLCPVLDPTLYREYVYSDKAQLVKKLLEAALPLKRVVLQAQPIIARDSEQTNNQTEKDKSNG